MGGNPFLFITRSLMVVFKIDLQGVFAQPAESNAAVSHHPYRPAFRAAMQAMEAKSRDVHLFRTGGHFQQLQDARALPSLIGSDPARLAGQVELLKSFMPEAANHSFECNPFGLQRQPNSCLFRREC